MVTFTVEQAQRDLLGCLKFVELGETVVLLRKQEAIAEIKPVPHPSLEPRPFGLAAGEFVVPDDFDEPLPVEVIEGFEGR